MTKALGIVGTLIVAATYAAGVHAQTEKVPAGKVSVSMCIGCHGIEQYRTVFPEVYHVPKIAGQSQQYLVKALQAYRAGERRHPSMLGIAKSLSDQDMAELAAYYAGSAK